MVRLNPDNDAREIIIDELMTLISDIRNGATINKFRLDRDPHGYILHASIIPKQFNYSYVNQAMEDIPMTLRELEEKAGMLMMVMVGMNMKSAKKAMNYSPKNVKTSKNYNKIKVVVK